MSAFQLLLVALVALTLASPARAATPIPLHDLIALFLSGDKMTWRTGAGDPRIRWLTDGVEDDGCGNTDLRGCRDGVARVRLPKGEITRLGKRVMPVSWTIGMRSVMPAKFGPEYVEIAPGQDCQSHDCVFDVDAALAGSKISIKRVCKSGDSPWYGEHYGFEVRSGGVTGYLLESTLGGNGTSSTGLTLYRERPKSLCPVVDGGRR